MNRLERSRWIIHFLVGTVFSGMTQSWLEERKVVVGTGSHWRKNGFEYGYQGMQRRRRASKLKKELFEGRTSAHVSVSFGKCV